jgi:putative ABC transport system permease protein
LAGLSYRSAAKIAVRDMHSSRGKFTFVILSVAIGVAALTGVRGFSSSFRATLLNHARSIMAADLSARTMAQPTTDEVAGLAEIQRQGIQMTTVTELLSMASAAKTMDPLLVSLKAVDPARYPFYGTVDLDPAGKLPAVLDASSVAVADDLLVRLKLQVGDQLKIGNKIFRIASVVVNEPDRLSGSFAAGPRVLISQEGLDESGLIAPGSHAGLRYLFKVPQPKNGAAISDEAVADLKARLIKLLPEAQITDYRETNPALTAGLDQATSLLSLMSLVALVLGAVGVAMAMRAHLQQRLDTIAIMKSLGAGSGQIIKIYLIQTLLLGAAGGLLGVLFGIGVQVAFPYLLASLVNVTPDLKIDPHAVMAGLGAGMLTTLLFTLPPLLDIRGIRPILILRREVDDVDDDPAVSFAERLKSSGPRIAFVFVLLAGALGLLRLMHLITFAKASRTVTEFVVSAVFSLLTGPFLPPLTWIWRKLKKNFAQIFSFFLILGGLSFIASRVSDSADVGKWFSVGLVAVLLVLLLASFLVLKTLKFFLSRTRLHLPSAVRHGLANLYRPGNPSSALLAALGMGVMQIMLVFLMQHAVVQQLHISSAPNLPNIFLVDIGNDEVGGVRALLKASPAVTAEPELLPVVSSRILGLDGIPAEQIKTKNFPHRMLRSINLTWASEVVPGATVTDGGWWTKEQVADAEAHPVVAVARFQAQRLGLKIGSTISFAAQDKHFDAKVVALFTADGQHAYSRAEFILPEKALSGLPVVWYGGVHATPDKVAGLQRALFAAYPTVTVINVAQILETIRGVVIQIIYVVQFLSAFSIFAGLVILASSIAGTKYRRIREVVVLKTLGATRARIATIFSIEFAVLGLVAGVVGIFFANLVVAGLLRGLGVPRVSEWGWSFGGLAAVCLLTVVTGWVASHRILGQKPLEVLREE